MSQFHILSGSYQVTHNTGTRVQKGETLPVTHESIREFQTLYYYLNHRAQNVIAYMY